MVELGSDVFGNITRINNCLESIEKDIPKAEYRFCKAAANDESDAKKVMEHLNEYKKHLNESKEVLNELDKMINERR